MATNVRSIPVIELGNPLADALMLTNGTVTLSGLVWGLVVYVVNFRLVAPVLFPAGRPPIDTRTTL